MKNFISKLRLWFKWKQECRKITCYLQHKNPYGKETISEGWFLEMKHEDFGIRETFYVGHLLGQNENSREWTHNTKVEIKNRILTLLKDKQNGKAD